MTLQRTPDMREYMLMEQREKLINGLEASNKRSSVGGAHWNAYVPKNFEWEKGGQIEARGGFPVFLRTSQSGCR